MVTPPKRHRARLSLLGNGDGQGLVEYALILVLIAVVVIGALQIMGITTNSMFTTINSNLSSP